MRPTSGHATLRGTRGSALRTLIQRRRRALKELALGSFPRLYWRYYEWKRGLAEPEIALVPMLCRKDAIAVDVGGNLGLYTGQLLRHAAACVVFEPIPRMAALLRSGYRDEGTRLRVEEVALSDHAGKTRLRVPRAAPGYATLEPQNQLEGKVDLDEGVDEFDVELRTLDSYELRNVGFVKIDVEGHEIEVLRGAEATVRREQPTILIEIEERHRPGSVGAVRTFLEALGYRGAFLRAGALCNLADLDLACDQNPAAPDSYVRNFVFTTSPPAFTPPAGARASTG